jgi:hypothetical protein
MRYRGFSLSAFRQYRIGSGGEVAFTHGLRRSPGGCALCLQRLGAGQVKHAQSGGNRANANALVVMADMVDIAQGLRLFSFKNGGRRNGTGHEGFFRMVKRTRQFELFLSIYAAEMLIARRKDGNFVN